MKTIDSIFSKLIRTPLIDDNARESITQSYNSLTSEADKLKVCKQIEYNYCTNEFLKTAVKS
jgi:hypothetical protein